MTRILLDRIAAASPKSNISWVGAIELIDVGRGLFFVFLLKILIILSDTNQKIGQNLGDGTENEEIMEGRMARSESVLNWQGIE